MLDNLKTLEREYVVFGITALILIGFPFLWASWQYWVWAWEGSAIAETSASQLFQLSLYLVLYGLLIGIFALVATPIGYAVGIIAIMANVVLSILLWLYRKICQ